MHEYDLTCKRGSVGQIDGLLIPKLSDRFRPKPEISNSHGVELHRPSNKGTKLLLEVIKAIIIITGIYVHYIFKHIFILEHICQLFSVSEKSIK